MTMSDIVIQWIWYIKYLYIRCHILKFYNTFMNCYIWIFLTIHTMQYIVINKMLILTSIVRYLPLVYCRLRKNTNFCYQVITGFYSKSQTLRQYSMIILYKYNPSEFEIIKNEFLNPGHKYYTTVYFLLPWLVKTVPDTLSHYEKYLSEIPSSLLDTL